MDFLYIAILLIIILFSMTLHEMAHAFVGFWLGDRTAKEEGRLTINPLAHIDPFLTILLPLLLLIAGGPIFGGAKPVPFVPHNLKWGEFGAMLVGIIGPITNFMLACLGVLVLFFVPPSSFAGSIIQLWISVNLGFFIFNMLPIPPLDGSRLLYYLAPEPVREIMQMIERYGLIVIFVIVILFSQQISIYMRAGISFFMSIFDSILGVVV